MAAWITAAAMIGSPAGERFLSGQYAWQSKRRGIALLSLLGTAAIFLAGGKLIEEDSFRIPAWENRTGLEHVAARIKNLASQQNRRPIIYVYAEPALYFHLRAEGLEAVAPVADLQFAMRPAASPTLLAAGPHAEQSEAFQQQWRQRRSGLNRSAISAIGPAIWCS